MTTKDREYKLWYLLYRSQVLKQTVELPMIRDATQSSSRDVTIMELMGCVISQRRASNMRLEMNIYGQN